jgi:hypothetical protein
VTRRFWEEETKEEGTTRDGRVGRRRSDRRRLWKRLDGDRFYHWTMKKK